MMGIDSCKRVKKMWDKLLGSSDLGLEKMFHTSRPNFVMVEGRLLEI